MGMPDLQIASLFRTTRRPLLSLEFFPPKDDAGMAALESVGRQLLPLKPDFVTCTYGAGGSTRERTKTVCRRLREIGFSPVMPHLTCVGSSQSELHAIADEIWADGYRNIMTLRGDPPKGATTFTPAPDGLAHASDLARLLKQRHPDFCLGVAGYPETHPEAVSADADIARLRDKVAAGGDFVTTQLFFDNSAFFRFVDRCRAVGIDAPILPGLLPVISLKQVQRMCAMCQASLPPELAKQLEAAGGEGEAAEWVGIRWAEKQMDELLARGAPGIHLYILNRSKAVLSAELARFFENRH